MYPEMLTKDNIQVYFYLIPEAFRKEPELLGVICIDEEEEVPVGSAVVKPYEDHLRILKWQRS